MTPPQDIIALKRDGGEIPDTALRNFVEGITDGQVADAQIGAFAMAVLLRGMTTRERVTLTRAMRDSGEVLHWDLPGPVIDKHSTGGVGDTVSLMLAPALAACGAFVPMISGRGLGHTGGTLDKLESIPGYRTDPDTATLQQVTRDIGCAIIGQTADLAPADRRLYAVRDVTGTVESLDLICASILSKKLAAGLDALVLDVKFGSGAFMKTPADARRLAEALVSVANGAGCATTSVLTDMNEPLASAAGNALEMDVAVKFLRGDEIDSRLWDVSLALGADVLRSSGLAETVAAGRDMLTTAFQSGAATERFQAMITALGGPADFVENAETHLPQAPVIKEVLPAREGFVTAIDNQAIGAAVVGLGGGRTHPDAEIDPRVGLDWLLGTGLRCDAETPLARVHAADDAAADRAVDAVRAAYTISERPGEETPLILDPAS